MKSASWGQNIKDLKGYHQHIKIKIENPPSSNTLKNQLHFFQYLPVLLDFSGELLAPIDKGVYINRLSSVEDFVAILTGSR